MRSAISLNTSCSEITWLRALLVQLAKTWLEAGRSSRGLLAVRLLNHHLPLGMLLVYQIIELQTSYDCRKPPKRSLTLHIVNWESPNVRNFDLHKFFLGFPAKCWKSARCRPLAWKPQELQRSKLQVMHRSCTGLHLSPSYHLEA